MFLGSWGLGILGLGAWDPPPGKSNMRARSFINKIRRVKVEWRASHILIKDRETGNLILNKLKSGGNFSALAKEHSSCPSKSKGGDLGWFGLGQMVREFEEAVKKMRTGGTSNLVRTQFGFHVIKKTGER